MVRGLAASSPTTDVAPARPRRPVWPSGTSHASPAGGDDGVAWACEKAQDGGMENEGCRRWIERLGLYALGGVEARGTDDVSAGPISLAVPLIGGLIVAVTLYMLGAVVLVQGGGLAAITLGI